MPDPASHTTLTPEQRAYAAREAALCERLLADADFQEIYVRDFIGGLVALQKKIMAAAHGDDLERAAARLLLLEMLAGHPAEALRLHRRRLADEARAERRRSEGLPPENVM